MPKTITDNVLLKTARESIELVILRTQIEVAIQGPRQHLLDRIANLASALGSLAEAISVIEHKAEVVNLMEYLK